jgi:hypothetical protein
MKCSECERSNAKYRCVDCNIYICYDCATDRDFICICSPSNIVDKKMHPKAKERKRK